MRRQELSMLTLGIVYLVAVFITYVFQYGKIIHSKSVKGISSKFIIIGNLASVTSFMNSLVFYFVVLSDCPQLDLVECLNHSLGLFQIASQFLCFLILYGLYVFYYQPPTLRDFGVSYRNSDGYGSLNNDSEDRFSVEVRCSRYACLHLGVSLLVNAGLASLTVGLLSLNNWHGYEEDTVIAYGRTLGILSVIAVGMQYGPQMIKLYETKEPGSISAVTYLLLTTGNFISFFYLIMQDSADVTTWLPYLFSFCCQAVIVVQVVWYGHTSLGV